MIRILPLKLPEQEMFCLYDDMNLLAKCLYCSRTGEIFGIVDSDPKAAKPWHVAILKATMSSLEYAGISIAWSKNEALYPLLKVLRFQKNEDRMEVSLVGYFDTVCECGDHK